MKLDANILDKLPFALRVEIEENAQQEPLKQSELAAQQKRIIDELRKVKKPGERRDLKEGTSGKTFPEVRATDIVGKLFKESRKQVEKRLAVVAAAEQNPERYGRLVEEMDKTGKVDRFHSELRRAQAADQDARDLPAGTADNARVITGDFREQGSAIEDGSVDLIFTDPVYHRDAIPLYGDLAQFAARKLVDGGSLICYVGHFAIPDVLPLMTPHLRFWWLLASVRGGGHDRSLPGKFVCVGWKPLLWFVKGTRRTRTIVRDCVTSRPGNSTLDHP
jgi:hypothetical protein